MCDVGSAVDVALYSAASRTKHARQAERSRRDERSKLANKRRARRLCASERPCAGGLTVCGRHETWASSHDEGSAGKCDIATPTTPSLRTSSRAGAGCRVRQHERRAARDGPLLEAKGRAQVGAEVLDLGDLREQGRVDRLLVGLLRGVRSLSGGLTARLLGRLRRAGAGEELGLGAAGPAQRGRLEVRVVQLVVELRSSQSSPRGD